MIPDNEHGTENEDDPRDDEDRKKKIESGGSVCGFVVFCFWVSVFCVVFIARVARQARASIQPRTGAFLSGIANRSEVAKSWFRLMKDPTTNRNEII